MTQFVDFKMLLLRVILIMIVHKSISYRQLLRCNPDKSCEPSPFTRRLGHKSPNPLDCHSYYICLGNSEKSLRVSSVPIKCPDNETFSASYRSCERSRKCDHSCINICDGECSNYYYERIADIKDCSSFYTCSPGKIKVKTKCPPEAPYFDGVNCQESKYECCSCCDECTAYCHKVHYQIADPYDCRRFYLCKQKGFPEEENRYQCPKGQYFNRSEEKCEDEDKLNPCTPSCNNF